MTRTSRFRRAAATLAGMAILLAAPATTQALTPTVTTYPSSVPPASPGGPYDLVGGPDGGIWFTSLNGNRVSRMTVAGAITRQVTVPGFPYGIAAGSDSAVWFVAQGPSIVGRVSPAGSLLTKSLAQPLANPTKIVSGPDGALWFTETADTKAIGRIPATTPLATPDESRATSDSPNDIAAGPDGNLWFVQYNASNVGRMTPAGATTYFPLPPGIANPEGIAAGPDGNLWYTTLNPARIVRITPTGVQQPFVLPATPFPGDIALGPDGALWITLSGKIARFTTAGAIETFARPADVGLNSIAAGPDGNMWFTESNSGRIGRITTPPAASTGAATAVGPDRATATGSVNGRSQALTAIVEYAPAAGGATKTTAPLRLATAAATQTTSIPLRGLRSRTGYRYRLVATNPTGSATGELRTFTTGPPPKCRIRRIARGKRGALRIRLACSATRKASIRATFRVRRPGGRGKRRFRTVLYGKASKTVVRGKAVLLLKPRRGARSRLAAGQHLRVRVAVTAANGTAKRVTRKTIRVRRR